jgi:hypothetical protein
MEPATLLMFLLLIIAMGRPVFSAAAADRDVPEVVVLNHEWRPSTVWERTGKTKFIWKATVFNRSDQRKKVFAYYDLLDENGYPLARNVASKVIKAHDSAEIVADSYILSQDLPKVKKSRVTVKIGFPN